VADPHEGLVAPRPASAIFISKNRRPLSALLVFVALAPVFYRRKQKVFLNPVLYMSVFTSLPIAIILTIPLCSSSLRARSTCHSIDHRIVCLGFAATAKNRPGPFVGLIAAVIVGMLAGLVNGLLVTKVGLSALVSTLGMNFLIRGLIQIGTQGEGIPLTFLRDSTFIRSLWGEFHFWCPVSRCRCCGGWRSRR